MIEWPWNLFEYIAGKRQKEDNMSKREKRSIFVTVLFALCFGVGTSVSAMHIMEGYLAPVHCVAWGIISLPFLVAGFIRVKKLLQEDRRNITLLAVAGAFVFVISSLKIPSLTGSCSHMTGTGLGAVLFGPFAVSILGIIVLIFQAILLAHGGLTTLGANTFSMAIAGPVLSFAIYKLCKKCKVNNRIGVFLAAMLGDWFTYGITSVQLAMAYPSAEGGIGASIVKFMGVFIPTQLPLSILEGILTVLIVIGLETYAMPELKALGFMKKEVTANE